MHHMDGAKQGKRVAIMPQNSGDTASERRARIERLRAVIAAGAYEPNALKVSQAIVRDMMTRKRK